MLYNVSSANYCAFSAKLSKLAKPQFYNSCNKEMKTPGLKKYQISQAILITNFTCRMDNHKHYVVSFDCTESLMCNLLISLYSET